jgi:hypothetical protein
MVMEKQVFTVVQQNVSLAFRLMEMQDERRQIEEGKIRSIYNKGSDIES